MKKIFILSFVFALMFCPHLHAQTAGQAPDDATKKISELVHAGNYADAQQLTNGLLVAYPKDQRLIKAQALIVKLMAGAGSASNNVQPTADASARLTGMDKVDYNALLDLARQAQQEMDKTEQDKLLQQFMTQSSVFLERHPEQMLLWQLRAASAISLNEPMVGYDAGHKLIDLGAADSNDPNLLRLLGELKNRGWLTKEGADGAEEAEKKQEDLTKYDWISGNWSEQISIVKSGKVKGTLSYSEEFSKSGSVIEGYNLINDVRDASPDLKGTIVNLVDIRWERQCGSDWTPVTFEAGDDRQTIKLVDIQNPAGHLCQSSTIDTFTLKKN